MIAVKPRAARKARPLALRPTASAAAAMRAALQESMDQIAANAPGAAAGKYPEYLHQLRVGARRLRAALRASRGLWRKDDLRALRRQLRELAAVSGPARDWDVFLRKLPTALRGRARDRQRKAHAALRRVVQAMQPLKLPRTAARVRQSWPAFARDALERLERKVLRRAERADWADPAGRHTLRIRLRRLRYLSEFMSGAFPGRNGTALVRSLKDLQDLLGELHDLEVARRLTRQLSGRNAPVQSRVRKLLAQLPAARRRFAAAPRFWRGL
jgi:CHAD domain-containing protein